MTTALRNLLLGALLALGPGLVSAADKEEAAQAAQEILASLQQQEFERLWDSQTSQFLKSQVKKESFIDSMTVGRANLGAASGAAFMQMTTAESDPASGFTGPIYAFNYRTSYVGGEFLERIVVVKDDDGEFRLSGLQGAPLPKQPATQQ